MCLRPPIRRGPIQLRRPPTDLRGAAGDIVGACSKRTIWAGVSATPGPCTHSISTSRQVKYSACSAPMARARRRRSTCSSVFSKPSCGAAFVNCNEVARDPRVARAQLAYVPEQVSLYPTLYSLSRTSTISRSSPAGAQGDASRLEALLDRVVSTRRGALARRAIFERHAPEGSGWPSPSPRTRAPCCSTSRSRVSIPRLRTSSVRCCGSWRTPASRFSWQRTTCSAQKSLPVAWAS